MERLPSPDRERPARHCVTAPGLPRKLGFPAVPWERQSRPYSEAALGASGLLPLPVGLLADPVAFRLGGEAMETAAPSGRW